MNYTPEQIAWYQSAIANGMAPEQAQAALISQIPVQQAPVQQAPMQMPMQQAPVQQMPMQQAMMPASAPMNMTPVADAIDDILNALFTDGGMEDHTRMSSGRTPPRVGTAWLRLQSYIEIGMHQSRNPQHKPKLQARIVFELHHKDHLIERDGVMVPDEITVYISKTHGQNSNFPKFFRALAACFNNEPTHMAQMLGHAMTGDIVLNTEGDTTYANLDNNGAWSFKPCRQVLPSGYVDEVVVPPLHGKKRLFLYDCPNALKRPELIKHMWDSIYDGSTYEKDVNGVKTTVTNNYFQEVIMSGLNWETSPTKAALDSLGCVTMTEAVAAAKAKRAAKPDTDRAQQVVPASVAPALAQQVQTPALPPTFTPPAVQQPLMQPAQPVQQAPQQAPMQAPAVPTPPAQPAQFQVPAAGAMTPEQLAALGITL